MSHDAFQETDSARPRQPLLTVVIPTLNRAHFLTPTLESVLQQDYPAIECLVVDGGSTDGTQALLRRYAPRIRWISEPDHGHADAINKGWRMGRGEILAWLNADDCWAHPRVVSEAMDVLRAQPDVDVIYGESARIDQDGRLLGPGYWRRWDLREALTRCHYTIPQPAAFMRRTIIEQVGWLDTNFLSKKDHELWLRIGLRGTIRHVPKLWALERACPGTWATRGDITAAACIALTKKFFTLPDVPPALQHCKRTALSNSYLRGAYYAAREGKHLRLALRYAMTGLWLYPPNVRSGVRYGWRQARKLTQRMAGRVPMDDWTPSENLVQDADGRWHTKTV